MKEREIIEKEGESLGDVVEDEMASTSVVRNTQSLWYTCLEEHIIIPIPKLDVNTITCMSLCVCIPHRLLMKQPGRLLNC